MDEHDHDHRGAGAGVGLDERPKIAVRAVEKRFASRRSDVKALGPVDLDIADGSFVCLVGPSGCGKSTLLRVMAGLVTPSAGEVAVHPDGTGRVPTAMVFQDYAIYPWKSVLANVRVGLDIAGVGRTEADAQAGFWLDRLGLAGFARAWPATLSGGMRQRVSIARALAVQPEVLLMDEPFAALDAQLRAVLQEELLALWESDQRTVVFVTHSIEEALVLGDRVVVMSARPGRVIGDHRVPFPHPRPPEVRVDPRFGELQQQIWRQLRNEVNRGLEQQRAPR